jgi:hypothetical protein
VSVKAESILLTSEVENVLAKGKTTPTCTCKRGKKKKQQQQQQQHIYSIIIHHSSFIVIIP